MTTKAQATASCLVCGDTGRTSSEERIETATMVSVGSMSHLCECRKALPPRKGRASWWSMEPVWDSVVEIPIGNESVEIAVRAEVPISEDNYRVVRRGNRYYPTLVDVEVGRESLTLHSDTARQLAQALIQAADAVDAIDVPDTDVCGHWAPCDCGTKEATR